MTGNSNYPKRFQLRDRIDATFMPGWGDGTKRVLDKLIQHMNSDDDQPFPSIETLASKLAMDRRTVMRAIERAKDIGIITIHREVGRKGAFNVYTFDLEWTATDAQTAEWSAVRTANGKARKTRKAPEFLGLGGSDATSLTEPGGLGGSDATDPTEFQGLGGTDDTSPTEFHEVGGTDVKLGGSDAKLGGSDVELGGSDATRILHLIPQDFPIEFSTGAGEEFSLNVEGDLVGEDEEDGQHVMETTAPTSLPMDTAEPEPLANSIPLATESTIRDEGPGDHTALKMATLRAFVAAGDPRPSWATEAEWAAVAVHALAQAQALDEMNSLRDDCLRRVAP